MFRKYDKFNSYLTISTLFVNENTSRQHFVVIKIKNCFSLLLCYELFIFEQKCLNLFVLKFVR